MNLGWLGAPRFLACLPLGPVMVSGGLMAAALGAESADPGAPLRTVAEVRRLSREEAMRPRPVRVRAMVTHWNPSTLDLFVQDETDGLFVAALSPLLPAAVGEWVEIEGTASPGAHNRVISRPVLQRLEPQRTALPPRSVSFQEVLSGAEDARWLEIEGVIQSAELREGPLVCWLRSHGRKLQVIVARVPPELSPGTLPDAEVTVRGVCSTSIRPSGELEAAQLLVNGWSDVTVRKPAVAPDLAQVPVRPLAALTQLGPTQALDHAVSVSGRLTAAEVGDCWRLTEPTGQLLVRTNASQWARMGLVTEVTGFLSPTGSLWVLENARVRQYALPQRPTTNSVGAPQVVPVVRDTVALATLPPTEAGRGYPVHLRGAVTAMDPSREQFCFQDDHGGAFIVLPKTPSGMQPGKEIEVEGFTSAGTFMPTVIETTVRVVGERPLPRPAFLGGGDILSGAHDGRWVTLEGVVRTVWAEPDYLFLKLSVHDKQVVANAAPVRNQDRVITAGVMVFHDLTEHRRAEEEKAKLQAQLVHAQKMESVGRLAGGVAHDFNNMLQAILGNAALALEQLAVSDSGAGMSREVQAHLFEPFFTTKGLKAGTGLGLATVYGIIRQNRGLINVYSEVGLGTTFKVYLPRAEAEHPVPPPPALRPARRGTETVLLVEDEEQILRLGQRLLAQHGYTVLTAHDPMEALAVAARHAGRIDLMITDVIMPGMNGKELQQRMTATQPTLRCLFMSGYTADVIGHHGVLDPGVSFLQKPFTALSLTEKVGEVLHGGRS